LVRLGFSWCFGMWFGTRQSPLDPQTIRSLAVKRHNAELVLLVNSLSTTIRSMT
jgi:hypothetical protein